MLFLLKVDFTNIKSFEKKINQIYKKYKKVHAVINCAYLKDKSWGKKFEDLKSRGYKKKFIFSVGSSFTTM